MIYKEGGYKIWGLKIREADPNARIGGTTTGTGGIGGTTTGTGGIGGTTTGTGGTGGTTTGTGGTGPGCGLIGFGGGTGGLSEYPLRPCVILAVNL